MHAHTTTAAAAVTATALITAALRRRQRIRTRDALRRYYTDEALIEARRRIAASAPYRVPADLAFQAGLLEGGADTVRVPAPRTTTGRAAQVAR